MVSGGRYVVEAMDGAMTPSTREGVRQPGLGTMTLLDDVLALSHDVGFL